MRSAALAEAWRGCYRSSSSRAPPLRYRAAYLVQRSIAVRLNSTSATSSSSLFTPDAAQPDKPFYVTTPIFYVNASPHVGHLHSLLLTDTLARFSRLRSPARPVIFATGTDEHGMKIQQAAKAKGIEEQEFCDGVSGRFRELARLANTSHTDFIRTSEPRHHAAVEHFWGKLVASGDIYKSTHSGWYSVSDECFYSASQVREQHGKMRAYETDAEVVWEDEENWKFRLMRYRDRVAEWARQEGAIHPAHHRDEILAQLEEVQDLSVSRPASRVKWGVPVPGDPDQTIYVWVDALINYLTVLGYPDSTLGWPADVHVVGKDIVKFHALHWPALLFSAGLPPPRRVLAHAHWTMARAKMSKSKGNVVDPIQAMEKYGADGVRWYLMRVGGSLPQDSDYSNEELRANYLILSSQLGNLLSRISSDKMLAKVREFTAEERNQAMDDLLSGARDEVERRMEGWGVRGACEAILDVLASANKLFTDLQPWASPNPTQAIMYAYHSLRISGILLQPFLPLKAAELLDRLGVDADGRAWEDAAWLASDCDAAEVVVRRLKEGGARWKGKGVLFPQVPEDDPAS